MKTGVAYYPEHWDEWRWETDLQLMSKAGIGLVRLAEFAWSKLEPEEGRFEFEWLDRILALSHRFGIDVLLGTPTATPPAWLHAKHPDLYTVDEWGHTLGFGTRFQRCLNHPVMREHSRRITEAMARHFAGNPAVIGWQTDNEFTQNTCYCDGCAKAFQEWLKRKFGSLDALNSRWGTAFWSQTYTAWHQIPLPKQAKCGNAHNPSLLLEFRRFQSQATVEFQREQVRILRKHCPNNFITHNFMGLHNSMDYYDLAEDLDFVSWDNYPITQWDQDTSKASLAHDVMRGIKGRNFWVMEEQCGHGGWTVVGPRPKPGQVRAWAWQAVASGANTIVFFRWRSCLHGTEQFWHGVVGHDGIPRRRYREVAQFAGELAAMAEKLDESVVRNEVAILDDYEQHYAFQIQPQAEGLGVWEQVRRFHVSLRAMGVGVDVVPLDINLDRYRVVILPGWPIMTEEAAIRLRAYVANGGTLIVNPRTGLKNADNVCHEDVLPVFLGELLGVSVDDYDALADSCVPVISQNGEVFNASVWTDALLVDGAEILARYQDRCFSGEPAVTKNRHGRGVAYYFGTCGETPFYKSFLTEILAEAKVPMKQDLPEGVGMYWREGKNQRFLFLINEQSAPVDVPIDAGMTPLFGEVDGKTATLPAHGVALLAENG